ncbi:serpin E3 isoform X1 [Lagopus muta]|uniref:serpin E3 isoform X1 n=1 Tax=Lagopus muta TaxID=64668 RepID=UPI00209D144E|nr:serpin E3 isoform X1 [Lagopus muta]XP_048786315.1 serpin E3 isoform X1 [Lagopus muta]XP_048786321.1 serpin E3 isoform X1 [Lagopus muta]
MLPIVFFAFILTWCLNKGNCVSYDELKDMKIEFAINLYRRASEADNRTNLVISPASVAISLELLQFGAQGNTFMELQNALGYNVHDQSVQDMLLKVYEGAADSGQGAVVQLACSLFTHTGVQLSPHFAAHVTHWANSSLQQADFTNPNQTAAQIQGWIIGNIADKDVHSVPSEEAVSPLSRVAVVGTMHFKSTWLKKFSFMDTQILPFTTAESSTLKVPTMHHTAEVNYGQFQTTTQDAFSVVELPYLGEKLSMFIVLPSHKRTPLSQIETHLSAKTIALWSSSLKRTKMDIFLPRFSIQSLFDLKTVFSALGIRDAFDPTTANFKGISEQAGLHISEAIHHAKIEVTEDGTKASGATAMLLLKRSRTPIFKADRPFTFFLRQANTGMYTCFLIQQQNRSQAAPKLVRSLSCIFSPGHFNSQE